MSQIVTVAGAVNQSDVEVICSQPAGELVNLTLGYASLSEVGTVVTIKKAGGPLNVLLRPNDTFDGAFQAAVIYNENNYPGLLQLMATTNGWHIVGRASGEWDFPAYLFPAGIWDDTTLWNDRLYWRDV